MVSFYPYFMFRNYALNVHLLIFGWLKVHLDFSVTSDGKPRWRFWLTQYFSIPKMQSVYGIHLYITDAPSKYPSTMSIVVVHYIFAQ